MQRIYRTTQRTRVKIETEEIETVSIFCPWSHGFAKRNEIEFGLQFRIEIETKTMWNQGVQVFVSRCHEIETELYFLLFNFGLRFALTPIFLRFKFRIRFWNSARHQCGFFPMLCMLFRTNAPNQTKGLNIYTCMRFINAKHVLLITRFINEL